ncbi:MAG: hypothetical protein ACR2M0_02040 [Chloroflexia bacterium]
MLKQTRTLDLWLALAALFGGLLVGYVNLHTDETPFVALPLLVGTALLGFVGPRGAWRWASIAVLVVLLMLAYATLADMRIMKLTFPRSEFGGAAVGVLLFSFTGVYLGVLARKLFSTPATEEG